MKLLTPLIVVALVASSGTSGTYSASAKAHSPTFQTGNLWLSSVASGNFAWAAVYSSNVGLATDNFGELVPRFSWQIIYTPSSPFDVPTGSPSIVVRERRELWNEEGNPFNCTGLSLFRVDEPPATSSNNLTLVAHDLDYWTPSGHLIHREDVNWYPLLGTQWTRTLGMFGQVTYTSNFAPDPARFPRLRLDVYNVVPIIPTDPFGAGIDATLIFRLRINGVDLP